MVNSNVLKWGAFDLAMGPKKKEMSAIVEEELSVHSV